MRISNWFRVCGKIMFVCGVTGSRLHLKLSDICFEIQNRKQPIDLRAKPEPQTHFHNQPLTDLTGKDGVMWSQHINFFSLLPNLFIFINTVYLNKVYTKIDSKCLILPILSSWISSLLQRFGDVTFNSLVPPEAHRTTAAHTFHKLLGEEIKHRYVF